MLHQRRQHAAVCKSWREILQWNIVLLYIHIHQIQKLFISEYWSAWHINKWSYDGSSMSPVGPWDHCCCCCFFFLLSWIPGIFWRIWVLVRFTGIDQECLCVPGSLSGQESGQLRISQVRRPHTYKGSPDSLKHDTTQMLWSCCWGFFYPVSKYFVGTYPNMSTGVTDDIIMACLGVSCKQLLILCQYWELSKKSWLLKRSYMDFLINCW